MTVIYQENGDFNRLGILEDVVMVLNDLVWSMDACNYM